MKSKATLFILALCFVGVGVCFAADPNLGTWKLSEAKSKIGPGLRKNSTVVYEAAGNSVKVTIDGTESDGKPFHKSGQASMTAKTTLSAAIQLKTRGH